MTCAIHPDIPASAYCRTCGKGLCESCKREVKGVIYCQDCLAARLEGTVPPGAQVPPSTVVVPVTETAPNPGLALFLGFIPGVGAFYNGQYIKGFAHVIIFALLIRMADIGGPWDVLFGLAIPTWIFYMVADAYRTARARLLGQPLPDPLGLNNLFGTDTAHTHPAGYTAPAATYTAPPAAPGEPVAQIYPAQPVYVAPGPERRPGPTGAIIAIVLGVIFLFDNLGIFHWSWTGRYWPVILIAFGVYLAAKRMAEARGEEF